MAKTWSLAAGAALCLGMLAACGGAAAPSAPVSRQSSPTAQSASVSAAQPVSPSAAAPKPSPSGPVIKLGVQGRPDQIALELAIARGYFAQEGLNVQEVQVEGSSKSIPALATNQVQVANFAPAAGLFNALDRGIKIRIVADYAHAGGPEDKTLALVARNDLVSSGAIKSVKDLQGRPVALGSSPGSITDILLARALEKDGAPNAKIDGQHLGFPDTLTALGNKQIDAGMLVEPLVTAAEAKGVGKVLVPFGAVLPGSHASVLAYSPQFASEQPDAATRFMVGYLRGVRDQHDAFFLHKDEDKAIDIAVQRLSVKDRKVWETATPESIDLNGKVNVADLRMQAEFHKQHGTLQGDVPKVAEFVDTRFTEAAVKQLGAR